MNAGDRVEVMFMPFSRSLNRHRGMIFGTVTEVRSPTMIVVDLDEPFRNLLGDVHHHGVLFHRKALRPLTLVELLVDR